MKMPRTLRDWLNIIGGMLAVFLFVVTCHEVRFEAEPIVRQLMLIKGLLAVLILGQIHQRLTA